MNNLDERNQKRQQYLAAWQNAMSAGNDEQAGISMREYFEEIQSGLMAEVDARLDMQDGAILAARGVRTLTNEEQQYYDKFISAVSSTDPKQALTGLAVTMPRTIIESVFEELAGAHPLLDAINFVNTTGLTEFIVNKGSKPLAAWGKLCDEIAKELSGNLVVIPLTMSKLSAWIPVCKSMLTLGAAWIDRYVRTILYDALAYGLEDGIINGTGVDQPIGMLRDIEAAKSDGEAYKEKAAVKITDFGIESLGKILATIAVDRNGRPRKLGKVLLIANPVDNYTKIAPATKAFTSAGYISTLPYPLEIVESEQVPAGKAILGRAEGYFMGIGMGKEGKIEYSDEYKFLPDERTYLIKILGSGLPKDNTSFAVLDISAVKPTLPKVSIDGAATPPVV